MISRGIQILFIALPICLFGWLFYQELVPSGVFQVDFEIGERSPFIDQIAPDSRVEPPQTDKDGDRVSRIYDEPAFIFVHPHRGFDDIDVELRFKNRGASIIEFGALAQLQDNVFDLHPVHNTIIDALEWEKLEDDDLILYQRESVYDSLDAFMQDPPDRSEISTYFASIETPYRLENYFPRNRVQQFETSLRGSHEFKTYIKDETLSFVFDYMDMNRDKGADPLRVIVFGEDGITRKEVRIEDDGNTVGNEDATGLLQAKMVIPGLEEGVYKIQFEASRDIFIRRIRTPQQKLVILNNVYFGDDIGWREVPHSVRFWTDAKDIDFITAHAEGVQTVQFPSQQVSIESPYEVVRSRIEAPGVVSGVSPKGDFRLFSLGLIALSKDSFFRPDPIRMGYSTDLDASEIDYVLTSYRPPEQDGNWLTANVSIDARDILLHKGDWKFAYSIPGIVDQEAVVDAGPATFILRRPPLGIAEFFKEIGELFSL